jgi:diguanylate cyclase (GGDEF)-like protein
LVALTINQLIPPILFSIFALSFLSIWHFGQQNVSARTFSIAYAFAAAGFFIEALIGSRNNLIWIQHLGDVFYIASAMALSTAITQRYGQKSPKYLIGLIGSCAIGLVSWFRFGDENLSARVDIICITTSLLIVIAVPLAWRAGHRLSDKLLFATFIAYASFVSLSALVVPTMTGEVITNESLRGSLLLAIVNVSVSVLSLLTASLLFSHYLITYVLGMREESNTDSLSGLLNRRGFEGAAIAAISAATEANTPLCLIVCDIDHFKSINDTYGHALGDNVIHMVGALLKETAGGNGIAGRIGGEEFCIALPNANIEMAMLLAESVRAQLELSGKTVLGGTQTITASFGVELLRSDDNYHSVFDRADKALYQAKNSGRNRVVRGPTIKQSSRSIHYGAKVVQLKVRRA